MRTGDLKADRGLCRAQSSSNGAKKADYKDDDRVEGARLGCPEHLHESRRERSPPIKHAVPRRFHPKESPSRVDLLSGCLRHLASYSAVPRDAPRWKRARMP